MYEWNWLRDWEIWKLSFEALLIPTANDVATHDKALCGHYDPFLLLWKAGDLRNKKVFALNTDYSVPYAGIVPLRSSKFCLDQA